MHWYYAITLTYRPSPSLGLAVKDLSDVRPISAANYACGRPDWQVVALCSQPVRSFVCYQLLTRYFEEKK